MTPHREDPRFPPQEDIAPEVPGFVPQEPVTSQGAANPSIQPSVRRDLRSFQTGASRRTEGSGRPGESSGFTAPERTRPMSYRPLVRPPDAMQGPTVDPGAQWRANPPSELADDPSRMVTQQIEEVAQLLDESLASLQSYSADNVTVQGLTELGQSLKAFFDQLSQAAMIGPETAWQPIADSLADLSTKVDRRERLKAELAMTQDAINRAKGRLLQEIQSMARAEQERLSMTQLRSKMVADLAERVISRLR
jgi:hypothetical protein